MKKIDLITFSIFTLIISFTFLSFGISSRSGECIICAQVVPNCSNNEILIPQTCNECAHCVTTSSTSSGCPQIATDCVGEPSGCKSLFGIYDPKICKCVCLDSTSNSSEDVFILNESFAGIWKGKVSLKKIILKLCIKNEELKGTINSSNEIEEGEIISQEIISKNKVKVTVNDKNDFNKEVTLELLDKKHLLVSISNEQDFEVKKTSSSRNCKSIPASSSSSGNNCNSKGICRGENGEELSCPKGTQCSGLPAYGCYPPGCQVPICLSPDTRIKTDSIQKRIADIREGEIVLTDGGKAVRVKKVSKTPVKNHKILKIRLNDGTVLEISPKHPTADGKKFKDLKMGDVLDGRLVVETMLIPYIHSHTYDILPDSKTGNYYANGVLIGSTLK